MANVRGLIGFNPSVGTARLFAAYAQDIVDISSNTGYGLNLNTSNDCEFEKFLDRVFFQNNDALPLIYNTSTNRWTTEYVGKTPLSKYLKRYKSRLYLGYCNFVSPQIPQDTTSTNLTFSSRVFYSDLFEGNVLTWGIEWGRNGATTTDANRFDVTSASPLVQDFKARNIKVGDPIFITNGNASLTSDKPYLVNSIVSPYRLTVDRNFPVTATGQHFWVGSNWFDVASDDGDEIKGFGENSDRLLIFKLMSLWWYNGSQLRQVKGAPGTSYNRSIINDRFGNTYYFHGSDPKLSGIYKYNGVSSIKISRAVDPWISAMSTSNYNKVVAWAEGNELKWWIGNLSTTNYIDAITNAVIKYNVDTQTWSIDIIQDTITAQTTWRTSGVEDTFLGTSDDQILQMDDGNSDNGVAISSILETKIFYPAGSEIINEYPYIQVVSRNARGVRVKYKLWGNPIGGQRYSSFDKEWWSLGQIEDDMTEFSLDNNHYQSSGIQFRFEEMSILEKDAYVEKISIFYRPNRSKLL